MREELALVAEWLGKGFSPQLCRDVVHMVRARTTDRLRSLRYFDKEIEQAARAENVEALLPVRARARRGSVKDVADELIGQAKERERAAS